MGKRRIAVIGSGQSGLVAAHGLVRAGHEVKVYSDRSADAWLNESRPTGTAARFQPALTYERSLGLNVVLGRAWLGRHGVDALPWRGVRLLAGEVSRLARRLQYEYRADGSPLVLHGLLLTLLGEAEREDRRAAGQPPPWLVRVEAFLLVDAVIESRFPTPCTSTVRQAPVRVMALFTPRTMISASWSQSSDALRFDSLRLKSASAVDGAIANHKMLHRMSSVLLVPPDGGCGRYPAILVDERRTLTAGR